MFGKKKKNKDYVSNKKNLHVVKSTDTGRDLRWENETGDEHLMHSTTHLMTDEHLKEEFGLQKVKGSSKQRAYIRSLPDGTTDNNLDVKPKKVASTSKDTTMAQSKTSSSTPKAKKSSSTSTTKKATPKPKTATKNNKSANANAKKKPTKNNDGIIEAEIIIGEIEIEYDENK